MPNLTPDQKRSVWITGIAFVLLAVGTYISLRGQEAFLLALSAGGLGGVIHELFQSGGKISFIDTTSKDGFYLGSLAGVLLGAVARVMAARFFLTGGSDQHNLSQLACDTFLPGLSLKGAAEALSGKQVA